MKAIACIVFRNIKVLQIPAQRKGNGLGKGREDNGNGKKERKNIFMII